VINQEIVEAWDRAPASAIHPTRRHVSEDAYWASGVAQAEAITTVLRKGCSVLDYGCGDGRVAIPLAKLGHTVTGADSSPEHLGRLTDPQVTTVLADGTDLAADLGRKFDALICLAVLIHYDYESGKALMAAFGDVVRKGGTLVLDAPVSDTPSDRGGWIGVTTWDETIRDDYLAEVGFVRVQSALPWAVYRRT
jgi:2-polyprenyl-3-methyl-5-hydroxy-6-metoxy-1,4-benzoquinol methylase